VDDEDALEIGARRDGIVRARAVAARGALALTREVVCIEEGDVRLGHVERRREGLGTHRRREDDRGDARDVADDRGFAVRSCEAHAQPKVERSTSIRR
jgi:hypothetical protein